MWREIEPDEKITVTVDGHRLVAYSFGKGEDVLFLVNGGPGLPCDYLREAHSCFVDQGFRVIAFDQLDCGASDRPNDPSMWTLERHVRETEGVRRALGLGKVHFLGHSWGGWQAVEYALTYPENLASLILSSTVADMAQLRSELDRLKAALGPETVAMMQRHEAQGSAACRRRRHPWCARSRTGTWAPIAPCRGRMSSSISATSATGPAWPTFTRSTCRC